MDNEDIIDLEETGKTFPSPYKIGFFCIVISILVVLLFVFFQKELRTGYTDTIIFGTLFANPIIGMVYICLKGDSENMFMNIFKTGFIYFEVMLVLFFVLTTIAKSEEVYIGDIFTWIVFGQLFLTLVAGIAFLIWLFPGQFFNYLHFRNNLKQQEFRKSLENNNNN